MSVKTKIIEIEPNWLLVTFEGAKPDTDQRAYWLNKTLVEWLAAHPGYPVLATLPVLCNGALIGVNVWLEMPGNPVKRMLFPDIHPALGAMHKEHVEALLQEAYKLFFERGGQSVLAAVNRRGVAVVFTGQNQRVSILPAEKLRLEEHAKAALDEWLAAPRANYFVIEAPLRSPPG